MSYYGQIFDKPQLYLINNSVTEGTISDLMNAIDVAFDNLGDILGDLKNENTPPMTKASFFSSVLGSIGSLDSIGYNKPVGEHFDEWTQSFVPSKEIVLDLVPDAGPIVIIPDTGIVWNRVGAPSDLVADGDYAIVGRTVTFYIAPTVDFSVTYAGTYPALPIDESGYLANVYPDPQLISSGDISRPMIMHVPSGRERILLPLVVGNSDGDTFGAEVTLSFNSVIESYVDNSGATECPIQYISAWILDGGNYRELDVSAFYILSSTIIEIDTDEILDGTETIVFSLANVSISDAIKNLHRMVTEHNHDKFSAASTIDHDMLTNLMPISSDPDIIYAGSSTPGNDHPQYIHREGYIADAGTYNNAMLGDFLIGSTDPTSLFENISANSHKLVFGSTAAGISVYYRSIEQDLLLYSPSNGLSIVSNIGNNAIGLTVDGGKFFNDVGDMCLSSPSGTIRIVDDADRSILSDLDTRTINTSDVNISGNMVFEDLATMEIGGTLFTDLQGDLDPRLEVSGNKTSFVNDLQILNQSVGTSETDSLTILSEVRIQNSGSVKFFPGETSIAGLRPLVEGTNNILDIYAEDGIRLSSSVEIDNNNGINSGLSIKNKASGETFLSIYTATMNGGGSLSTSSDTFVETHSGDTYFIHGTTKPADGKVWGVDTEQLDEWSRSGIHAGGSSFSTIKVDLSNLQDRRGVSFGDFNHMWVTGAEGGSCPEGWMILESQNGVAFINSSSSATDCSTINYSDISAKDVQSFGNVIAEGNIVSGGDLSVTNTISARDLELIDSLYVNGEAKISGDTRLDGLLKVVGESDFSDVANFNARVNVNNTLDVTSLNVGSSSIFTGVATFESDVSLERTLSVTGRTDLTGSLVVQDGITSLDGITAGSIHGTSITAADTINAIAGIRSGSTILSEGTITCNESILADGDMKAVGVVSSSELRVSGSAVISGTAQFNSRVTFSEGVNINPGSSASAVTISGDVQMLEDVMVSGQFNAYGQAQITSLSVSSNCDVGGKLDVAGSLDIGANIVAKNGHMEITSISANRLESTTVDVDGVLTAELISSKEGVFSGDLSIQSGLAVTGEAQLLGGAMITGPVFVNGDTEVVGSFTQANAAVENNFSGETKFHKSVSINADLSVEAITVGHISSGDNITTVYPQAITTPRLEALYALLSEVEGRGYVASSTIFDAIPELASYANSESWLRTKRIYNQEGAVFSGPTINTGTLYVDKIKNLPGSTESAIDLTATGAYYA